MGNLVFMSPWILAALSLLPVLWWIVRSSPPLPKTIEFPPTRFLMEIHESEDTPLRTPWWLLLLRLMIAALIIIALAQPIINPGQDIPGKGPVRIIIDNDATAGNIWNELKRNAEDLIGQASRTHRPVILIPTIDTAKGGRLYNPVNAEKALGFLHGMETYSWPAQLAPLADHLNENKREESVQSIWLHSGSFYAAPSQDASAQIEAANNLAAILQNQGGLILMQPEHEYAPILLTSSFEQKAKTKAIIFTLKRAESGAASRPFNLEAITRTGQIAAIQNIRFDDDQTETTTELVIPPEVRNDISHFSIAALPGAGSILLTDEQFRRRLVGIAGSEGETQNAIPLTGEAYYLSRALTPFADTKIVPIHELVEDKTLSAIMLPDISNLDTQSLNALAAWVENGGTLIRFAGQRLAETASTASLLPVRLREGGRNFNGVLSWEHPLHLTDFETTSPFYGLEIPDDVSIKQQVLAVPETSLAQKSWANLEDGTPLVTAEEKGNGRIILFHTTATPDWSNLSLSGLFVEMLGRITRMSGSSMQLNAKGTLHPKTILDGLGRKISPPSYVRPLQMDGLLPAPSQDHPAGYYSGNGMGLAFNLGQPDASLHVMDDLPSSVEKRTFNVDFETALSGLLLTMAAGLFLIDLFLMLFLSLNPFSRLKGKKAALILCCALCLSATPSNAQDHSQSLWLAYITTGNDSIDQTSHDGLEALRKTLKSRTTIEAEGVTGVAPDADNLAFYPFLYWPITQTATQLRAFEVRTIQRYLNNGGTILFDLLPYEGSAEEQRNQSLRAVTGQLNIPPIEKITTQHVLTRSFYILKDLKGPYSANKDFWVSAEADNDQDGVSPVLIGYQGWAAAWAGKNIRPNSKEQEMALRFGVNLAMYMLTGTYKNDQIHVQKILRRMDQ